MKYRYVGSSGLVVSRVSLGTMTFGAPNWGCDEKTAHEMLEVFRDNGGNFIDTANNYAGSESERIIGKYLENTNRSELIIASKCFFPQGSTPGTYGLSRKHILQACEDSLRRLRTDYIDLYFVHAFDPNTPLDETMEALNMLVHQGMVRYIGCSNLFAWQFTLANGIAAQRNGARFVCGQHMYNLIHREVEQEVLPACHAQGMSLVAWSPLGGGLLTGKYRWSPEPEEGSRMQYRRKIDGPRFWHKQAFDVASLLGEVAKERQIDRVQLALGWVLREPRVASIIVGAKSVEQLKANLKAAEPDIPDDVYEELSAGTQPPAGYLSQFARHVHDSVFSTHAIG